MDFDVNPMTLEFFKPYPTKMSHDTQYEGDLSDIPEPPNSINFVGQQETDARHKLGLPEDELNLMSARVVGEDPEDAIDNDNLEVFISSKDNVQENTETLSGIKQIGDNKVRQNFTNNIESFPVSPTNCV